MWIIVNSSIILSPQGETILKNNTDTWFEARSICSHKHNGRLPWLISETERQALKDIYKNHVNITVWAGIRKQKSSNPQWVSGKSIGKKPIKVLVVFKDNNTCSYDTVNYNCPLGLFVCVDLLDAILCYFLLQIRFQKSGGVENVVTWYLNTNFTR